MSDGGLNVAATLGRAENTSASAS